MAKKYLDKTGLNYFFGKIKALIPKKDNLTITENGNGQLQTVGVIDQKTSNTNKFWTGTLAEYNAITTKDPNTFYTITDDNNLDIIDMIYPVGSIYISVVNTNPGTLFGVGTWEQIKDTFLLSAGDAYTAGSTGGESSHTLTIEEMPSHKHEIYQHVNGYNFAVVTSYGDTGGTSIATGGTNGGVSNLTPGSGDTARGLVNSWYTGGSQAHNNMPPYLTVYMWKRVS